MSRVEEKKPKNKIIMHIDMNSYFASVEQQANPFLRGKAVGVCAYLSDNGTIIASSKEAKAKGIKTGTRVREAKLLDPNVILLENEPAKYRSTTEKIFKIFSEYSDTVEPYSIDEAFIDLTGWLKKTHPQLRQGFAGQAVICDATPPRRGLLNSPLEAGCVTNTTKYNNLFLQAEKIAKEIKQRILNEVGDWLKCSIGISYTKFLAKFAGDHAPKGGILIITPDNLDEQINNQALTEAWGINVRMEARFKALGIYNLLGLKNSDPHKIKNYLGRCGYYLWAGVNGEEITEINQGSPDPKSIGHSYALPKWTRDKDFLLSIFYKLAEKTGRRLRSAGKEAGGIMIGIGYTRHGGLYKSFSTAQKMFTTEEIFSNIESFIMNNNLFMPARNLAISVFRLSDTSSQMKLFGDNLSKKDLSLALDKINDKYGEYTVVNGRMFNMKDKAVDRIGFRKSVKI